MKFCQFTAWRQAILVVESIPNSVSTLHCQAGQTMLNFSCLFLLSFGNIAMLNYFWDCVVTWMLTLGGTCHSSTPLHKNIVSGQEESRVIQAQAVQLDMCLGQFLFKTKVTIHELDMCLGQFYWRQKWPLKCKQCSSDWANDMDGDSAHSGIMSNTTIQISLKDQQVTLKRFGL